MYERTKGILACNSKNNWKITILFIRLYEKTVSSQLSLDYKILTHKDNSIKI